MDWLVLAMLVIIWAAYLLPPRLRRGGAHASIEEFERHMGMLEQTERASGRWIVAPRKGEAFVGRRERVRSRARARRRRVFVFLVEALALTFLIGMFPPLRGMWLLTAAVAAMLTAYVWLLVQVKRQEDARPLSRAAATVLDVPLGPAAPRHDRELPWLSDADPVHVRVRLATEYEAVGAGI
jgi:hypothetical protein